MMPTDSFQPVQLKGEIMDLEFTIDTDHRKRRRNRTTQSCLNCHTSKRKCDRKRPCQRCIQLGLTGLCVYEIDDPALRDDPSIDENTRLRNRIAELESLVRELRGKPHPRWAENNFRDGDPNEKWHSRATKYAPSKRSPDSANRANRAGSGNNIVSPIKTEPISETSSGLYRFSPSPGPGTGSMRYNQSFSGEVRASNGSPTSPYDEQHQRNFHVGSPNQGYTGHPPNTYHAHSGSGASSYSTDTTGSYGSNHGYGNPNANDQYHGSPHQQVYCPCRTSPTTGVAYLTLSQQLQNSLPPLRQYTHHSQCQLFRKINELNDLMHNGIEFNDPTTANHGTAAGQQTQPYDSNTPSDNELLTPLSASSGHASFHPGTGSPGVSPQEWNNLAAAGYNPYFPLPATNGADHHSVYTHVMP
ncbi:Heme-responsive zinc finger transcription factor HAP1 [Leucoagaricus sp. SymC.cos]|nr:Heme-responsive zinc finger transcription factor HAP1 [Leucoagaricus sp. SymC.cos]